MPDKRPVTAMNPQACAHTLDQSYRLYESGTDQST